MAKRKNNKPQPKRRYVKVQDFPATWVHACVSHDEATVIKRFREVSETVVRNGQVIPKSKLHSDNLTLNEDV